MEKAPRLAECSLEPTTSTDQCMHVVKHLKELEKWAPWLTQVSNSFCFQEPDWKSLIIQKTSNSIIRSTWPQCQGKVSPRLNPAQVLTKFKRKPQEKFSSNLVAFRIKLKNF